MNPSVAKSLREYARGMAGGLMFSLPLLYTMEVWWTGFVADPMRLLIYVAATFVLLLGFYGFAAYQRTGSARAGLLAASLIALLVWAAAVGLLVRRADR